MKKDLEKFYRDHEEELDAIHKECMDGGVKIELHEKGGELSLRMHGSLPMLFYGACEIVKQLAQQEGKERPGAEKNYVEMLCNTILEELEEGGMESVRL